MPVWKKKHKALFSGSTATRNHNKCMRRHSWPCCNKRLKQSLFPATLVRMCLFDSHGRYRFTRCVWSLIKVSARCIWSPCRSPPPLCSLSLFFLDGHKNKENICGRLVGQHGSGGCEAVFRTVWKGKISSFFDIHNSALQSHNIHKNYFFFDFLLCALHLSYSVVIWLD